MPGCPRGGQGHGESLEGASDAPIDSADRQSRSALDSVPHTLTPPSNRAIYAGPYTSLFISTLDGSTAPEATQPKESRDTSARPEDACTPLNIVWRIPAEAACWPRHTGGDISRTAGDWMPL
jgi:hypothetical protein